MATGHAWAVARLLGAGADLTQPRHVIHYLYFGSQESAAAAAGDAGAEEFDCDVRDPRCVRRGSTSTRVTR